MPGTYVHNYEPALKDGYLIKVSEIEGLGSWQTGTPSGAQNGVNVAFTLPSAPTVTLFLFLNGIFQVDGGVDYSLSGAAITMNTPPLSTDTFIYKFI